MSDNAQDSLRDAIARNCAAVLSLPTAGILHHHKTRFLGEEEGSFWVESIAGQQALIDQLINSQGRVGMAFKTATHKILFTSPITRRWRDYPVNKQVQVEALLLPFPEDAKVVQRRGSYRVHVPEDCEIALQAWRIPEHAILRDKPSAVFEVEAKLRDVSIGGIGFLCPPVKADGVSLVAQQRLRILIRRQEIEVVLEGRVRRVRPTPDGSAHIGVQFKNLEDDLQGRQTLAMWTNIVGQLHREEIRRMRLGLGG